MNYLVCSRKGQFCQIRIVQDGEVVATEHEEWALRAGGQIIFVYKQMAPLFKNFYMMGTFQEGALYGVEYEEMCLMLTEKLGLSDRARYEEVCRQAEEIRSIDHGQRYDTASKVLLAIGKTLWTLFKMTGKLLGTLLLIPLLIHIFSKRR